MRDLQALRSTLGALDGQSYGNYKRLKGTYDLQRFTVCVDHVQPDPFASPSKIRVLLSSDQIRLPQHLIRTKDQRVAAGDFLARTFHAAITHDALKAYAHGPEVLERSTVVISQHHVELRLEVALPAAGRRIKGYAAQRILIDALSQTVEHALRPENRDDKALEAHVKLYIDQLYLAAELPRRGLVAFVGNGSILPRAAGNSQLPLKNNAVAFTSPPSLTTTFDLPSGATMSGMGIPAGITVIVGGGFHGKSTMLSALSSGVHPRIAGDGREWVITCPDAVSIRAEDGRPVTGVNIAAFISGLPNDLDTQNFSTTNASGSTSQAANLMEALESGASTVLIDEDTSATNFMIRDERMRQLIPQHKEPITPFVERIRPLWEEHGVSTIVVAGGSGAFFDAADHVIAMVDYQPQDLTEKAKHIAHQFPMQGATQAEFDQGFTQGVRNRVVNFSSLAPRSKTKPNRAKGVHTIMVGREAIDLSAVCQLVDSGQTTAIAHALDILARRSEKTGSLGEAVLELMDELMSKGLDALSPHADHPGYLTMPRAYELHAAVNRFRSLSTR